MGSMLAASVKWQFSVLPTSLAGMKAENRQIFAEQLSANTGSAVELL